MENPETLEIIEYPRANLPEGAKEGDALTESEGILRIDQAETETRAARLRERFNRLRKK